MSKVLYKISKLPREKFNNLKRNNNKIQPMKTVSLFMIIIYYIYELQLCYKSYYIK